MFSCVVSVEADDGVMGEVPQGLDVVYGSGGSEGGDGECESVLVEDDDVHIAFDEDDGFFEGSCFFCDVAIEEDLIFVEEGRGFGVDIFSCLSFCVVTEESSAEGDDLLLDIGDGYHESGMEEGESVVCACESEGLDIAKEASLF